MVGQFYLTIGGQFYFTIYSSAFLTKMEATKVKSPDNHGYDHDFHAALSDLTVKYMQEIGRKYPNCGFGGMFYRWVFSDNPEPYNIFGNGAAMRVSPAGFVATSEWEAEHLAETVTEVTHNKSFALIMRHCGKLYLNLKCDPFEADFLRQAFKAVIPGWHMNKQHWNTVVCDEDYDVPEDEIKRMVANSYDLIKPKVRKRK